MVKVYGNILRDTGTDFMIVIAANKGVAPDVGLSGTVWFGYRQVRMLPQEDGFDVFECSYPLAKFKAQQQCEGR